MELDYTSITKYEVCMRMMDAIARTLKRDEEIMVATEHEDNKTDYDVVHWFAVTDKGYKYSHMDWEGKETVTTEYYDRVGEHFYIRVLKMLSKTRCN